MMVVFMSSVWPSVPLNGQCLGLLSESHPPPAVRGMSINDEGFRARFWAWDDLNRRRGGEAEPYLVSSERGILLTGLDWSWAEFCEVAGPVQRTAVLFEALGDDGFGRWALVNLGADENGLLEIDRAQGRLGHAWSQAVAVPTPSVDQLTLSDESLQVELSWTLDPAGEGLSDLADESGLPLPSVRGYGVYIINGPQATSRPWDWSFADDLEADAVNGFSTDTTATLQMTRSIWAEQTVAFAVALTFDGDGDAEGERPQSRSVHGDYLGAPSPWFYVPPPGVDVQVAIVDLWAALVGRRVCLHFDTEAEPPAASYRVWWLRPSGSRHFATGFAGGQGSYEVELEAPAWCRDASWDLALEMLDGYGRVIASEVVTPAR
jgi:hypothetical protein